VAGSDLRLSGFTDQRVTLSPHILPPTFYFAPFVLRYGGASKVAAVRITTAHSPTRLATDSDGSDLNCDPPVPFPATNLSRHACRCHCEATRLYSAVAAGSRYLQTRREPASIPMVRLRGGLTAVHAVWVGVSGAFLIPALRRFGASEMSLPFPEPRSGCRFA
jgi:hypothetical protein